jgi:cell surface protein SprA
MLNPSCPEAERYPVPPAAGAESALPARGLLALAAPALALVALLLVSLDGPHAAPGTDLRAWRLAALLDTTETVRGADTLAAPVVATTDTLTAPADTSDAGGMVFTDGPTVFGALADTTAADTTAAGTTAADTSGAPPSLVATSPADTTAGAADTLETARPAVVDTSRAARLLPPFQRDGLTARIGERRSPLAPPLGQYWRREVQLDTSEHRYTIREIVGGEDVRMPLTLDLSAYRDARLRLSIDENFRTISQQRIQRQQRRAGVGIGFDIPGGAGRGLTTIFGSDQVDLRVNGNANVNLGFAFSQNEQQQAATGQGGRVDPNFGQELGLSIIGSIGDKLEVNVNYDTQNDFDFQNQVRLLYTGYDDEIIRRIEAGNVFLPVESDLIRGGQRLFGLKTDLQIGGLAITAVASQQDAESDELVIQGGSQSTPFTLVPTNYENNAHFYLGYYFHNRWDLAHSQPPNPITGAVNTIEDIEVYKFDISLTAPDIGADVVAGVALLDLGEPVDVLQGGRTYYDLVATNAVAPAPAADRYPETALNALRQGGFSGAITARNRLAEHGVDVSVLRDNDLVVSRFRRLRRGQDFEFDPTFGFVSLAQPLNESDVLAVAYRYRRQDGTSVTVGDLGQGSGSGNVDDGDRIILKLLRPSNLQPTDAAWGLTMRNIYRVGGRGLDADGFELQVLYAGSGQSPQRTLPGVDVGQQWSLLRTLGLDRVNQDGQPGSDDLFDFLPGFTINRGTGRVIFPFREPFGQRLRTVIEGNANVPVRLDGIEAQEAIDRYVFDALYTTKPEIAARQTDKNVFRITGSSRGSTQEFYDLGFAIVEGSVEVRSGDIRLNEGTDYTVDYTSGTVNIINPAFLTAGRDIRIGFERQQFLAIQKKTLLGVRALYEFTDRFAIGGTWMQMSERPMNDKYRVGEEPITNSIWGLDARYEADPQWITRAVDALPFLQTRAPSRFEFRGEFAQLNPGHPETIAFNRSRDRVRGLESPNNRDFKDDELGGISYIDDFEGSENTFSLMQPAAWRLASGPTGGEAVSGAGPPGARTYLEDLPGEQTVTHLDLRSNWRGLLGWYAVGAGTYESRVFAGLPSTPASRPIRVHEVFPERQIQRNTPQVLTTLDVYFDPFRRGPYNYNAELGTTYTENPQHVWGGMMQRLPDGYRDFEARNNIEFVEFIFSPFGGRMADEPIDPGARLFIDLGRVSEDIIPDGELNTEDGMLVAGTLTRWGRRGSGPTDGLVNVNPSTLRTENLGLNGLPSGVTARRAAEAGHPYDATEEQHFAEFLDFVRQTLAPDDPRRLRAEQDPSADDFRSFQDADYFNDPALWPGGAVLQERFTQFYSGFELSSLEAQNLIAQRGTPGLTRTPNTEDLNLDGSLNTVEALYRYEIPLNPTELRNSPFFVEEIHNPSVEGAATWFVVRIPVRSDERAAVGSIDGFREVDAVRVWTQGHSRPATMRFAKLELVGSQWLQSTEIMREPQERRSSKRSDEVLPVFEPDVFVATVNTEQNPNRYRVPNGAVRSFTRDPSSGDLLQNREQAIVLRAENLIPGAQAAIFRPYTRSIDLTKYSNLRLFVHGSGFDRVRYSDDVRVFLRIGSNETGDFYEIEQPLYAWSPPEGMTVSQYEEFLSGGRPISNAAATAVADSLWQTNVPISDGMGGTRFMDRNSINVAFAALNMLKVERDLARDPGNETAPWPLDLTFEKPVSEFAVTDLGDFAPPGAVLRIRGTPTIQNVTSIAMGVRKASGGSPVNDVEVWFNELRVSGYDEQRGWSAYARTSLRLADFATINARYARQTDAFGELVSGLGSRNFRNEENYSVTANVDLHRFLPERFGWRFPLTLSVQNQITTPRFSPRRGDITVDQEIAQIQADETLDDDTRRREMQRVLEAAQTATFSRTIRVPISKTGSRSPILRHTLDALALTYTNTSVGNRTPLRAIDDRSNWSTALQYRLALPRPHTVRPMWFLEDLPVLGLLGDLRLNVLPQSIRLSADAARTINLNQDRQQRGLSADSVRRALELRAIDDPGVASFLHPLGQRHSFLHNRTIEVQYSPFGFLSVGFGSQVRQSLDAAGVDASSALLVQMAGDPNRFTTFDGHTLDDLDYLFEVQRGADDQITPIGPGFAQLGIMGDADAIRAIADNRNGALRSYPVAGVQVRPVMTVLSDVFTGERPVLTDSYGQTFTSTLQSPFERVEALDWLRITPISFSSSFGWGHVPISQLHLDDPPVVASLTSRAGVRGGLGIRMRELATKIKPWRELSEAQREADRVRQQERATYEQQLRAFERVRQRSRDAAEAVRRAEAEAELTGEPVSQSLYTALERATAADTLSRPSRSFSLPDPVDMLRRTALAVTGPRDINITYDGSFSGAVGNAQDAGFSVLSSALGTGPSMRYRLGFDRRYPATPETRFVGSADTPFTFSDRLNDEHRFGARTSLEFSPTLRMDLVWDLNLSERETLSYTHDFANHALTTNINDDGRGQSTVWAMGGSYERLFNLHLDRLRATGVGDPNSGITGGSTLESSALTNNMVADDFRRAFLTEIGRVGAGGFFALPLPNWTVTYSGLNNWPIISSLTQSATLRHGYSATYDSDFRSMLTDADVRSFTLMDGGGTRTAFTLAAPSIDGQRVESARVNQRFQPLIGLDLNFRAGIQANINWNSSNTYGLSAANAFLNQSQTEELAVRLSFTQTGFRLPLPGFGSRQLSNQLRLSLVMSRAENMQRRYALRDDLQAQLSFDRFQTPLPETFLAPMPEASTRLTMEPQISYTLSRAVTAQFFMRYERYEAENSRIPTTTNMTGGFNFRVSFAN